MSVAQFKSRPEKNELSLPLQSVADNQSINVGTLLSGSAFKHSRVGLTDVGDDILIKRLQAAYS